MGDSQGQDWMRLSPDDFLRRWYRENYRGNAYGSSAGLAQRWMHRSLERGYTPGNHFARVLEIGGNVGEHLEFLRHSYDEYILSDLIDSLTDGEREAHRRRSVAFEVADVQDLPFDDGSFDRVLSTCVLHHVPDPEAAMAEMRRVTRPGARLDIFLSSDPGMLFRLARWAGPYRAAKRAGLGPVKQLVDARDHRNHVGGLRRLVRHVFRDDSLVERTYPVPSTSWNSSLWLTYRITKSLADGR